MSVIVLNSESGCSSRSPCDGKQLLEQLNSLMLELKGEFIADQGIDYKAMKESDLFAKYKDMARLLGAFDASALSESARKAFFINVYNLQTLHALAEQAELPEAPKDVDGMWNKYAYNIGGLVLTLDDIEHGVLRCNKGHPAASKGRQFDDSDPRNSLVLGQPLDPRIHFALNCGARACPPIRIYQQADSPRRLVLSKLLMWYKADFGSSDVELVRFLADYVSSQPLRTEMLENADSLEITFRDYDWATNKK